VEALRASYLLALARRPTHVLVYGPHGVGKTTIVKEFALALGAEFVRTQGRNDLLPSDFIADREPEAGADGALRFPYRLKEDLARLRGVVRPGIWFVDEVDKIPPRSLFALLEPMEEGRITLSGVPVADSLWFLLVATANTKRFDRFASDIPLAVRDRFAITLQVGFLSREEDLQVLRASIEEREAHPSAAVFSLPDDAGATGAGAQASVR
jgi:MoxR-like ATPase